MTNRLRKKQQRSGGLPFPVFLLAVCAAVTVGATSVRALTAGGGGAGAAVAGTAERLMAFLDYFAGVFTLLSLTAAVVCGLAATDRLVLTPRLRVAAQSVHRATSVAAVGFLVTHIAVKVAENDASPLAALLPFGGGATFAVGLGTLAADLLVLAAATGAVRGRFAGSRRPWLWRVLHASAYVCWPLALAHGLTAGRAAAVWVLWSYGVCAAMVALALLVRALGATDRRTGRGRRNILHAHAPAAPSRAALNALRSLSVEHEPVPYAARAAEEPAEQPAPQPLEQPVQPVVAQAAAAEPFTSSFSAPWPDAREHPVLAETPPHGIPMPAWPYAGVPADWTAAASPGADAFGRPLPTMAAAPYQDQSSGWPSGEFPAYATAQMPVQGMGQGMGQMMGPDMDQLLGQLPVQGMGQGMGQGMAQGMAQGVGPDGVPDWHAWVGR